MLFYDNRRYYDIFNIFIKCDSCTAFVSRGDERTQGVSCESPGGSVSKEREKRKPENIRVANVWNTAPPPFCIQSIKRASYIVGEETRSSLDSLARLSSELNRRIFLFAQCSRNVQLEYIVS